MSRRTLLPHLAIAVLLPACGRSALEDPMALDSGPCTPAESPGWEIEVVDRPGRGDWANALAVDGDDVAHVAYMGGDGSSPGAVGLRYASRGGGGWTSEAVLTDVRGAVPSLELDVDGTAHLAFQARGTDGETRTVYAGETEEGWTRVTLEPRDNGLGSALALGADGGIHVVYAVSRGRILELRYAVLRGTAWINGPIDVWVGTFWGASIAVEDDGTPHIAYVRDGELRHVFRAGRKWVGEVVEARDRKFDRGFQCVSLAIDDAGAQHLTVQSWDEIVDLAYATNATGRWVMETIDPADGALAKGFGHSLALDAEGAAHVSYAISDGNREELWYATNAAGPWQIVPVDTRNVGAPYGCELTSLAVDGRGRPHISYYVGDPQEIRYAVARTADDC